MDSRLHVSLRRQCMPLIKHADKLILLGVIAQQYSSGIFGSLCFHFRKKKFGELSDSFLNLLLVLTSKL
jgi:hypothetical protein